MKFQNIWDSDKILRSFKKEKKAPLKRMANHTGIRHLLSHTGCLNIIKLWFQNSEEKLLAMTPKFHSQSVNQVLR